MDIIEDTNMYHVWVRTGTNKTNTLLSGVTRNIEDGVARLRELRIEWPLHDFWLKETRGKHTIEAPPDINSKVYVPIA